MLERHVNYCLQFFDEHFFLCIVCSCLLIFGSARRSCCKAMMMIPAALAMRLRRLEKKQWKSAESSQGRGCSDARWDLQYLFRATEININPQNYLQTSIPHADVGTKLTFSWPSLGVIICCHEIELHGAARKNPTESLLQEISCRFYRERFSRCLLRGILQNDGNPARPVGLTMSPQFQSCKMVLCIEKDRRCLDSIKSTHKLFHVF